MILLHRIGASHEEFRLNPDLIVTIEAHPDTVLALVTNVKLVVAEDPDEVVEKIRQWRASVSAATVGTRPTGALYTVEH